RFAALIPGSATASLHLGDQPILREAVTPNATTVTTTYSDGVINIQGPFLDADQDGIPDYWEVAHGLSASDTADAGADADGDGLTNLQEFQAGTDPLDPSSALQIVSMQESGGYLQLTFNTTVGKAYRIESNDDYPTQNWILVGSTVGSGVPMQITD